MKRGTAKCVHCGNQIPSGANYCHHCGRRTRGLHTALKLCSHCKKQIDAISTYCKHCGHSLSGKKPTSPLSFMLHILVFLILLLALFLLYTYPRPLQQISEEQPVSASVSLRDLACTPTARGFDVCGTIAFEGGAYAKAHIPGGEELDATEKQYEHFTYCQSVGSEEGMRVIRGFVYDEQDNLIADRGEGVSCDRPDVTPLAQSSSSYTHKKTVQLYTENQFDR
ncbi:MAG: zinc ribbon domain-containing protein, partial [Nanoarchaeota archaeon]